MKRLTKRYQHGFIGIGRMGQAILKGMLQSGLAKPAEVLVSDPSRDTLRLVQRELKVAGTLDNRQVAERCRIVWLAVKPFQAQAALRQIRDCFPPKTPLVSFVTGVSTQFLRRHLRSPDRPLIRLMPNTPCLIGDGMTGVFFGKGTPPPLKKKIMRILKNLGEVEEIFSEQDLDLVTGLSGSGPAFVYLVAQGLVAGGEKLGLKAKVARDLAYQTLLGAAGMLKQSGHSPDELIKQVATKGGTTEAGLEILKSAQVASALAGAVRRAALKAKQIREENDRCTP